MKRKEGRGQRQRGKNVKEKTTNRQQGKRMEEPIGNKEGKDEEEGERKIYQGRRDAMEEGYKTRQGRRKKETTRKKEERRQGSRKREKEETIRTEGTRFRYKTVVALKYKKGNRRGEWKR
jgi:hypothetical protein